MKLVRFDPFTAMRDLDRLVEQTGTNANRWVPRVDVLNKEDDLVVRTEVPGINPESLEVTVEGRTLTIKGSRSFDDAEATYHRKEIFDGSFERNVLLPKGIDTEAVTASSNEGLLEVSIPKRPEVLPRKVEVSIQR
ncbi:MAG: Hsp20/alpha crystallin family protein [Acidimicrobiia bacterium]|nr:Hsp20/alpha crystallin family protein [Acidimicrobiia bacterium]